MDAHAAENAPAGADWLNICRRLGARVRQVLVTNPATADRATPIGTGEGGDTTLAVDRDAEAAIFAELAAVHESGHSFTAVSEERGSVAFGDAEAHVLIDPIDGSLNAKRANPSFALSVAVASGPSLADVEFAYVFDFGAEEEFTATRGAGAELNGRSLGPVEPRFGLEAVALETASPALVAPVAEALAGKAYRLRIIGSIALALAYVAAGRFDGLITLKRCRTVDMAASQLIAREAGALVALPELDGEAAPLDLKAHSQCIAAWTDDHVELLTEAAAQVAGARH